jgi:hypothetical protein
MRAWRPQLIQPRTCRTGASFASPGEYKEFRTKISPLGLSWCVIPLQKYSVVYGRLIQAKLTPGPPSGGGRPHRDGAAVLLEMLRGLTERTRLKAGRCLGPCKVSGRDRTKMFHVKHFGTIGVAGNEPRLVGLRSSSAPCRETPRRRRRLRPTAARWKTAVPPPRS